MREKEKNTSRCSGWMEWVAIILLWVNCSSNVIALETFRYEFRTQDNEVGVIYYVDHHKTRLEFYLPGGLLKSVIHYHHDGTKRSMEFYNESSVVESILEYENDKKVSCTFFTNGIMASTVYYDEDGGKRRFVRYDNSGKIYYEKLYE